MYSSVTFYLWALCVMWPCFHVSIICNFNCGPPEYHMWPKKVWEFRLIDSVLEFGIVKQRSSQGRKQEAVRVSINTLLVGIGLVISADSEHDWNGPHSICISRTPYDSSRLRCYALIILWWEVENLRNVSICINVCKKLILFFLLCGLKKTHIEVHIVCLLLSMVQTRSLSPLLSQTRSGLNFIRY